MSFSEYEDCFVWQCDGCGLTAEFEGSQRPGYFMSCVDELKRRGWRIWRDEGGQWGEWHHKCAKCRRTEPSILDMKFPKRA